MNDSLVACFEGVLRGIGEDVQREGLADTPSRAAASLEFLTSGYQVDVASLLQSSLFDSSSSDLIVVQNIEVYSLCEHHLLPFFGRAHVAYVPDGKILGLSKVARLVEAYARRLQVQETLGQQVVDAIMEHTSAAGAGIVIEATHLCMAMRGVQQRSAVMKTSAMRGILEEDARVRNDFNCLIKGS